MALIAGGAMLAACSEPEQEATSAPAAKPPQAAAEPATSDRDAQARAVISEDMPYAEVGDELVWCAGALARLYRARVVLRKEFTYGR